MQAAMATHVSDASVCSDSNVLKLSDMLGLQRQRVGCKVRRWDAASVDRWRFRLLLRLVLFVDDAKLVNDKRFQDAAFERTQSLACE